MQAVSAEQALQVQEELPITQESMMQQRRSCLALMQTEMLSTHEAQAEMSQAITQEATQRATDVSLILRFRSCLMRAAIMRCRIIRVTLHSRTGNLMLCSMHLA